MLVGILSDSHDKVLMVRRAVALFDQHGAECLIHCGDVGAIGVFDELVGRQCHFVWGNCDRPDGPLLTYLDSMGLTPPDGVPLRLTLGGKRFAVFHGHEPQADAMAQLRDVDYILHGHTHSRRDQRLGAVRIINPGALFRARPATVAILDTVTDVLKFHEIAARA